jgi:hypothetical protein
MVDPGTEGGEFNCASPGISAANFRIARPPAPPLPEVDELPAPAEASGMVPVDAMPTEVDLVVVADDGATLMVARGTATPTLLLNEDGSLDWEVALSLCSEGGGVGKELTDEEPDGEGSTDAMGAFCGFWMSRCGLRVEVCASFFSKDFVVYGRVGAILSMRWPWVPVPLVSRLTGPVSGWAEAEGISWSSDMKTVITPNERAYVTMRCWRSALCTISSISLNPPLLVPQLRKIFVDSLFSASKEALPHQ